MKMVQKPAQQVKPMTSENNGNGIFRNHPFMILKNMGGAVWIVIWILVSSFDDIKKLAAYVSGEGNRSLFTVLIAASVILLLAGLTGGFSWFRWYRITMSIDDMNFYWKKGGIFRRDISIPLNTISNCNLNQNLIEKIFGLYALKIDVNSSEMSKGADLKLILAKDKAVEVRDRIFSSTQNTEMSGGKTAETIEAGFIDEEAAIAEMQMGKRVSGIYRFDIKDIIRHSVMQFSVVTLIVLIGGIAGFSAGVMSGAERGTEGSILFAAMAIVPVFYQGLQGITRLFNFKVQRIDSRLLLSYGLLNTREYTVPVDKINAIQITESLFARMAGYAMVSVNNIGMGDEKQEKTNICLYMKKDECMKLIGELLPEYDINFSVEKQEKQAITYYAISYLVYIAVPGAVAAGVLKIWQLGIAVLAVAVLAMLWSSFAPGISIGENILIIRRGLFTSVKWVIPYRQIEMMKIHENPLGRRLGIAKILIHIRGPLIAGIVESGMFRKEMIERNAECFRAQTTCEQ